MLARRPPRRSARETRLERWHPGRPSRRAERFSKVGGGEWQAFPDLAVEPPPSWRFYCDARRAGEDGRRRQACARVVKQAG